MTAIYFTCLHLQNGGVEKCISVMANAFVASGHEVTIWCTYRLGEPAYHLDERVKLEYLTALTPNREAFKRAVRAKNPIAIVKEGWHAAKVLWTKKRVLKQKIQTTQSGCIIATRDEDMVLLSRYGHDNVHKIGHLHHDYLPHKHLPQHFQQAYGRLDDLVLLAPQLVTEVSDIMSGHNAHTRLHYVPNTIGDVTFGTPTVNRTKQFFAVGRLSPEKGFERLIAIWAAYHQRDPEAALHIVGDGEMRAHLEMQVRDAGLEQVVHFHGMLANDEVLQRLRQAEAFVLTSYTEGFGLVYVEAMSQGAPCIVYDVRVGPRMIITMPGHNGFIVPDGDVTAFCDTLSHYSELSDDERLAVSAAAIARAQDFTLDKVMAQWEDILALPEKGEKS